MQGARHLVQTSRLQNLRTDTEILLKEASITQYVAAKNAQREGLRRPSPYVVNKQIAGYIRVRHARHLPLARLQTR